MTKQLMTKNRAVLCWVVYEKTIHGKASGIHAVCEQSEWDEMERAQPGGHVLIKAGITNEGEAERLARTGPEDENTSKPAEVKALRR